MTEVPFSIDSTLLGKETEYVSTYTPSLLVSIPRILNRDLLGIAEGTLPFQGMDLWTAYELSWLDRKGKPRVAIGRFSFPCTSAAIVESKSFKLYLNSFNQTRFDSTGEVVDTLESDLATVVGAPVLVVLSSLSNAVHDGVGHLPGENIDGLAIEVGDYQISPDFLRVDEQAPLVRETLYSDLLKSNCPVTGQPDWASVMISYRGRPIDRAGLLRYVISFREHQDFHENCVERMFVDVMERCAPETLTITARYTRRGGLDINPYRSNCGEEPPEIRLVRQ